MFSVYCQTEQAYHTLTSTFTGTYKETLVLVLEMFYLEEEEGRGVAAEQLEICQLLILYSKFRVISTVQTLIHKYQKSVC